MVEVYFDMITKVNGIENIYLYIILIVLCGLLLWLGYLYFRNIQVLRKQNEEINYINEMNRTFFDAIDLLVYLKDENLNYLFVNKTVELFYNKSVAEIIGNNDYNLTVREFSELRRKTDLDVLRNNKTIVDEVRWDNRIYQTTKFPVNLPNGKIGVGAYVQDITDEEIHKRMNSKNLYRNHILVNVLTYNFDTSEEELVYVLKELLEMTESSKGVIYLYNKYSNEFNLNVTISDFSIPKDKLLAIKESQKHFIDNEISILIVPVIIDGEIVAITGLGNKVIDYDYIDLYQVTALMNGVWNARARRKNQLEIEKANMALREKEEKLQLLLNSTYEGIFGIDKEGICTFCNSSCLNILGYNNQTDLIGNNMHKLIHHHNVDGDEITIDECKVMSSLVTGVGIHCDDEVYWRKDGTSFAVEYFSYPQYKEGKIIGAVITFMDITSRKKVENDILYLSYHDSLTGLYNRRYFEEMLIKMDKETNLPISVIMGDVNGLKLTNDIFGHSTGDLLLQKAVHAIKSSTRPNDIVARWGGDEYIIILPKTTFEDAEAIADKIKEQFGKEQVKAVNCSISFGYETKTTMDESIYQVIVNAEKRMYENKILDRKSINNNTIKTIIDTLHINNPEEKVHSINVSQICEKIGIEMKLSESTIRRLKDAGYLHDIGKIILDERLLRYQGKLKDYELQEIRQHPIVGYRILSSSEETIEIAKYALSHHERWDGLGYPKGLKAHDIPQIARIISITESYDTMLNKKQYSKEKVIEEFEKNAGKQFDPDITKLFVEMIKENRI